MNFKLAPFAPLPPGLDLSLSGRLSRRAGRLAISYELRGRLEAVTLPLAAEPVRRYGLWGETCLEFFLGLQGSPRYWEFNLSPSGAWNIFRFTGYRQGMAEETALASLPFEVRAGATALTLALEVDLRPIILGGHGLEAGIAAVIKLASGEVSYWAARHAGPRPDFHRRDSFCLTL